MKLLDEAINRYERLANYHDKSMLTDGEYHYTNSRMMLEYRQLVAWLKELRGYRNAH